MASIFALDCVFSVSYGHWLPCRIWTLLSWFSASFSWLGYSDWIAGFISFPWLKYRWRILADFTLQEIQKVVFLWNWLVIEWSSLGFRVCVVLAILSLGDLIAVKSERLVIYWMWLVQRISLTQEGNLQLADAFNWRDTRFVSINNNVWVLRISINNLLLFVCRGRRCRRRWRRCCWCDAGLLRVFFDSLLLLLLDFCFSFLFQVRGSSWCCFKASR